MTPRAVLAYSGGLDTSVAARTLRDEGGFEVVAALVDLGQAFAPGDARARAAAAGAELRIIDAKEEFAGRFCLPAIHANALYEGKYPLVSALARPLIAEKVVQLARETGASHVAHGCTGKGNDQVRFEASFAALAPDLTVLAPVREQAHSRDEALRRAKAFGIPIPEEARTFSIDENLWGRTAEAGPIEDPWAEPPAEAYGITADPRRVAREPQQVVVGFERGRPVALEGKALGLLEIVAALTDIGGAHGVGRVDMIENRLVGIKSREIYEVPAALALICAHRDLEDLTLERDLAHEKAGLERRWAELCYNGLWFGPLHASLRAFMEGTQERVAGEVRLEFYRGSCRVVGRRSDLALYDHSLATYDERADRFDQRQAAGFVSLWSLPLRVWSERGRQEAPAEAATTVASASASVESPGAAPEQAGAVATAADALPHVWSGRFADAPAHDAMALTASLAFDRRLLAHDLAATSAHVQALVRAGLLEQEEGDRLAKELEELRGEATDGSFPFSPRDEDVHVAVERVLTERLGDLGAKVHAGRSRNDLVATDLRLWTKEASAELADLTRALVETLARHAERHTQTTLPGYTHLQRAQPVTLAHHLLAHAFALLRDADRLERAGAAADVSPLGAGALAGSTLGIDPAATARSLGFSAAFDNSIDAVASRDFAVEFLSACLSTALGLSRLAEELVLWASEEFGFVRVDDRYATGSSMMPQKRNPDVAELARAKAGRVLGDLVALAAVLKGLPLAYDRDMQEDKEAVFDARDALAATLPALTGMVATLSFDTDRMRRACEGGFVTATDLAEALVARGVPFREAHARVGGFVGTLEAAGRTLTDVEPQEWAALDADLEPGIESWLRPETAVARHRTPGGPAPESVDGQIAAIRERLRLAGHAKGARG
ncbi:MAG TPA: argininosuccinate lyase [Actinomycetota bacterium]|nr:argininosuccinate lyase [Actinomycetota bacterium]